MARFQETALLERVTRINLQSQFAQKRANRRNESRKQKVDEPKWENLLPMSRKVTHLALGLFDYGLVLEEDRDAVADGVNAMAFSTLQHCAFFIKGQRCLTFRTGKDGEQVAVDHNPVILRRFQS